MTKKKTEPKATKAKAPSKPRTKPAAGPKRPDLRPTIREASALSSSNPEAALALLAPLVIDYPAAEPVEHPLGSKSAREASAWSEQLTALHKTHASVLQRLGRHAEAIRAYEDGARCGGIESNACAIYALEIMVDVLDDPAAAIDSHRRWAEAYPNEAARDFDFARQSLLARAHLRAGHVAEAEAVYRKLHDMLNGWKTQVDRFRESDGGVKGSAARAKELAFLRRTLEQYAAKHQLESTAAPILSWLT